MHMGVQKFVLHLGTGDATKTDEFLEKFQRAFDPPSSLLISGVSCCNFSISCSKSPV